ncbi:hypothetical protein [Rhizobium sp. LjRoot254]|uniref:hypothetical protein n=1 Tax=Rhizobium sp. LjRoot254 TaxID=3342297 RepID=UPI003ECD9372
MTQKASPAKAAGHILHAFGSQARVGLEVSYVRLEEYFKRHHYPLQETASGLRYAQNAGWIRIDTFHSIALLEAGFQALAAMQEKLAKRGEGSRHSEGISSPG